MIRLIGMLVGLGFTAVVMWAFGVGAYTLATEGAGEKAAEYVFHKDSEAPAEGFSFTGPLGKYDRQQLQRGFQVYQEVCAACHGLEFVSFRNMTEIGFSEAEAKAIAAAAIVPGIDPNTGETTTRPGLLTDAFPSPYPNAVAAAAANNNAIPPDLSLITKARPNGSEYVYSLLSGYGPIPDELKAEYPEFETGEGLYFNEYFPNLNIAMAPPITMDGQVTYAPGNPEPTIKQMSADVAAFLTWAGEPTLEQRNQTGWFVVLFLLFATVLAYFAKKQVWADAKPKRKD